MPPLAVCPRLHASRPKELGDSLGQHGQQDWTFVERHLQLTFCTVSLDRCLSRVLVPPRQAHRNNVVSVCWFADSNRSSRAAECAAAVGSQFVGCNEPSGSLFFGRRRSLHRRKKEAAAASSSAQKKKKGRGIVDGSKDSPRQGSQEKAFPGAKVQGEITDSSEDPTRQGPEESIPNVVPACMVK